HARLHKAHKRGNSSSSITSPLSPVADQGTFTFETPKITYEEPWHDATRATPASAAHTKIKIKPYLRKLSSKDSKSLDLSRPSHENEGLAGLGISDYSSGGGYSRSVSDVNFAPVNGRQRHTRTTSNTSQFSTTSSLQRPPAPYLPSIRQTPQVYSPPISKSTPPSVLGSEHGVDDIMTDEEFRLRQNAFDPARRSGSLSSAAGVSPALRIHTSGSSIRLGASYSQSSLSLASPIGPGQARGDTLKSIDTTTSPSSRTSFDKAFGFIRGGREEPVDAASRAASIRAARQEFQKKEEAKERKYDKEANKQAERDYRKQYRKEDLQRQKSEVLEPTDYPGGRSVTDLNNERSTPRPSIGGTRPSVGGRQYTDHRRAHENSLPKYVAPVDVEKRDGMAPKVTKSRVAKGRWQRFIAWFKTRVLRMS
ncbi:hypothetical protein BDV95DRAFT_440136, partial [Massariosphaeria phaeospora]